MCVVPTPTATVTKTPTPPPTSSPTPSPTFTPTFKPCDTDMDCPEGEHCRGGFCKIERECTDHTMCFSREACVSEGTEPCSTGMCPVMLCECGGDCNLDGFVLGNEITKAILILGGVIPLSQCEAADINGDGQVMGNEITQAVLNLGEGCHQESQPLVFAHDRTEVVTLTIGSAT